MGCFGVCVVCGGWEFVCVYVCARESESSLMLGCPAAFAMAVLPCCAALRCCLLERRTIACVLKCCWRLLAAATMQTSEAERIGVDQVAKILPTGATSGSSQREARGPGGRRVRDMWGLKGALQAGRRAAGLERFVGALQLWR